MEVRVLIYLPPMRSGIILGLDAKCGLLQEVYLLEYILHFSLI